jgi:hypothetical protein
MDFPMKKILLSIAIVISLLFVVMAKSTTTPRKTTSSLQTQENPETTRTEEMNSLGRFLEIEAKRRSHYRDLAKRIFKEHRDRCTYPSIYTIETKYNISKHEYDFLVVSLWEKMRSRDIPFEEFYDLLNKVCLKLQAQYRIVQFFDDSLKVIDDLIIATDRHPRIGLFCVLYLNDRAAIDELKRHAIGEFIREMLLSNGHADDEKARQTAFSTEDLEGLKYRLDNAGRSPFLR